MKSIGIAVLAMSALLSTSAAQADILATATNSSAQIFPAGSKFTAVLDGPAAKNTIKFKTTKSGPVVITFYAECAVDGGITDWVNVDILVDPDGAGGFAPIAPTESDNAMCTGFEAAPNGGDDRWISAVVAGVVDLPKGNHKLKVKGYLGGTGYVRLDDILVTVQN